MIGLALAGLGASALGAGASYLGGQDAATARAQAIAAWQKQKAGLQNQQAQNAWGQGNTQQQGFTNYLTQELGNGQSYTPGTYAPTEAYAPPATGPGVAGPAASAYLAAMRRSGTVNDANLNAGAQQFARQQQGWAQGQQMYASQLPGRIQSVQTGRNNFGLQQQINQVDANMAAYTDPNSAYNMKLLGSVLGGGGGALSTAAAFL